MPKRLPVDKLPALVGEEVGASDWLEVTQERIDRFAEATGDLQWIHTDPERAAAASPYGAAIAHGFLTLSLLTQMSRDAFEIAGEFSRRINYGLNRVRFPAPVRVGASIRARFRLERLEEIDGGLQLLWGVTVEDDTASEKPCMAAEWLTRLYR